MMQPDITPQGIDPRISTAPHVDEPTTPVASPVRRCGYVALLGRPNAGKSTLLNACVGAKIAAVCEKPQTTRNRILGISQNGDAQLLFLDTPGIHDTRKLHRINQTMNRVAWDVLRDADVVCYLVDAVTGWKIEDSRYFSGLLKKTTGRVAVVASKIDKAKKDVVQQGIDGIRRGVADVLLSLDDSERKSVEEEKFFGPSVWQVSAKRPESVAAFQEALAQILPEGEWLFPEDDLTDLPRQFVCAELIREQVFRQLGAELPYQCAVKVDSFAFEAKLARIQATLIVQRESHKSMVIGKAGSRIKSIGVEARKALEDLLEKQVYLELFVKVQEGWVDNDRLIAEFASLENPAS